MTKAILLVMDSVGVGALPDAHLYGDEDSNTLANVALAVEGLNLPNLARLGLGKVTAVQGLSQDSPALGAYGKMAEMSQGKDTTTGHWELAGLISHDPMPTFPQGFPAELISRYEELIGRKVLGNKVASGTEIIKELGEDHQRTGFPIVYTSADSVFQIAAHEDVIPLPELYAMCEKARAMLTGKWAVGRVIARPFTGSPGNYMRTSNRHDYSLLPPQPTILDALKSAGKEVISVGKIADIFAGQGITKSFPTKSNQEGLIKTKEAWETMKEGLIFTNLVEFDSLFGHRNDPQGYAKALEEIDQGLGKLINLVQDEGWLFITADHGCDPTTASTDHSREYVPILVVGKEVKRNISLGIRNSFADVAATLGELFQVHYPCPGKSFLTQIRN